MRRTFLLLFLFAGCSSSESPPPPNIIQPHVEPQPPPLFGFYEAGRATWSIEGEPIRLIQVRNHKTGKVYMLAYHDGIQAESMVKIDEWIEEPESKKE